VEAGRVNGRPLGLFPVMCGAPDGTLPHSQFANAL